MAIKTHPNHTRRCGPIYLKDTRPPLSYAVQFPSHGIDPDDGWSSTRKVGPYECIMMFIFPRGERRRAPGVQYASRKKLWLPPAPAVIFHAPLESSHIIIYDIYVRVCKTVEYHPPSLVSSPWPPSVAYASIWALCPMCPVRRALPNWSQYEFHVLNFLCDEC